MASSAGTVLGDKYRSHIIGEKEKNTVWRFGAPPNYDVVNKLFEEGRTQEWAEGSLEEKVQRFVKTWEMEMFHKIRAEDFKTTNADVFRFIVNGAKALTLHDILKIGGYNAFLQTTLPQNLRGYNPSVETAESSHKAFTTTFPRGFALEIVQVYSDAPAIVQVQALGFHGRSFPRACPNRGEGRVLWDRHSYLVFQVDASLKIEKVEFFFDPAIVIGGLLNGPSSVSGVSSLGCPFFGKL